MKLTHTCCTYSIRDGYFASFDELHSKGEGAEIREEESEDLEELEILVAEFESKYRELGGTILEFLDGYWKEIMDEVMQVTGPVDLEALGDIRRAGVILEGW